MKIECCIAALIVSSASAFSPQLANAAIRRSIFLYGEDDDGDELQASLRSRRGTGGKTSRTSLVPKGIGIGTLAWGEPERGCFNTYNPGDLQGAYNALVEEGLLYFDTSESFGKASLEEGFSAEQLLGRFASDNYKTTPKIATTFEPSLLRFGSGAVVKALEASLERMGVGYVEVLQLGKPGLYWGGRRSLYKGLALCKERGMCNSVGVSGYNAKQVEHAHAGLAKLGVTLVSNRVKFSLLEQTPLKDGTVDTCKRLGVTVLAAAPLNGGLASARYTATNPTGGKFAARKKKKKVTSNKNKNAPKSQSAGGGGPPGRRRAPGARFAFEELQKTMPLHAALKSVAMQVAKREKEALEGREVTPAQVALNWVVAKGAVPLAGVNTVGDAQEVAGCVGWRLKAGDLETLDEAVEEGKNTKVKTSASYDGGDFLKW